MSRQILIAVAAIGWLVTLTSLAEARRGRIPIYIPGTGSSDQIVKVLDLPDIPALRHPDGRYVDLGYMHKARGGGAWIGYIGSSQKYVPLTEMQLQALLRIGGLDKLPPVPERPWASGSIVWLIVIGAVILLGLLGKLMRAGGSARHAPSAPRGGRGASAGQPAASGEWSGADQAMAQAIADNSAGAKRPMTSAAPRAGRSPAGAGPKPVNPGGFGQRGLSRPARVRSGFGVRGA